MRVIHADSDRAGCDMRSYGTKLSGAHVCVGKRVPRVQRDWILLTL